MDIQDRPPAWWRDLGRRGPGAAWGELLRRSRPVRLGTANLRWGMRRSALKAAGRVIARRIDVVGFQELRAPGGRIAVKRGLRTRGDFGWREGGECPQAFDKATLEVIPGSRRFYERVTPGRVGVTPQLPILRVAYRHRRAPGIRFVVYSTHLVPLAQNDPHDDHTAWRRSRWDAHWERLCTLVERDVEDGWTVFVLGDINDRAAPESKIRELHPSARWLARSGLDWIVVAGEDLTCRVRKLRSFRFRTGSDHRAVGVSLLLTAQSAPSSVRIQTESSSTSPCRA